MSLVQSSKFEGSETDIPEAVVDLFEADILAYAHDAHVDPAAIPADPTVGADVADLEPIGVIERWGRLGIGRGEGV
jgi:hypothetical protein